MKYLIKFFDEQYKNEVLEGYIHFSPLNKFTCELEGLTEAQADLLEGKAIELFDRKKEVLLMRIPETGKQVEIDYQTASVTKKLSNPELCYISSFVILNYDTDLDEDGHISSEFIEDVSDIANGRPFMLIELSSLKRSVTNFLSEQDNYDKAYSGPIEYTDEPFRDEDAVSLVFRKRLKYKGQREYRIAILKPEGTSYPPTEIDIKRMDQPVQVFDHDSLKSIKKMISEL